LSETDPFSDAAFTSRLQKLLSMLGSEQPGEADAARRKIGDHLAHHRLSFTDLAQNLGHAPRPAPPGFTQGARELSLERQLALARIAKEEAAHDAESALYRVRVLEAELQQATFEIGRTVNSQGRVRAAAALACIVAAGCLIVVILPHGPPQPTTPAQPARQTGTNAPASGQLAQATADPVAHLAAGERFGHAAVQDLAIRFSPNDEASIRAFLNYGEKIVIQAQVRVGPQTWLLVRSATGMGWVRSGDVLQ
jgi:hypothetical protein